MVSNLDDAQAEPRLGRYTVLRRLGKGGMGEVFLARQTGARGFERLVALKRILPQYSSNKHVVNMLIDEARICELINHPNVVRVLELDEADDSVFVVMEYVDGQALSRLMRALNKGKSRFDPLEACYIVMQMLAGLHAAHVQKDAAGDPAHIIHRDVSPQNVLLTMDGQVKVIDFGIARARDRLEATSAGAIKGKLRYLAPEQARPSLLEGDALDARVDVFAAGIVLFELLAMRPRFSGRTDMDVMEAILAEKEPDLRKEGLVDDELQAILHKALAKDRTRRFKDAATFASQLRAYIYARDPGFSDERIAQLMGRAFSGRGAEAEEHIDAAPVVRRGRHVATRDVLEHEAGEETRTQLRPRLASAPTKTRRRRLPLLASALAVIVVVIGGAVVVRRLTAPVQLPAIVDAGTLRGPSSSNLAAAGAAPLTDALAPVDLGGSVELTVVAKPDNARISLAYQPDPKYSSPARLKAKAGELLDLLVEAEGYEALRERVLVDPDHPRVEIKLLPIPLPIAIRTVPRDAEIYVGGKLYNGGTILPEQEIEITARHPFYVEKTVRVRAKPGEALVVDLALEEKPLPVRDKGPPGEPVERPAPPVAQPIATPTLPQDAGVDPAGPLRPSSKKAPEKKKPRHESRGMVGTLMITTRPSGATVFVDGNRQPKLTPARLSLPEGAHRVTVKGKGAEKTFTVEIAAGDTVRREITLE